MKLTLKNTPEQVELIRAMGSRNGVVAAEAAEAFAAFLGPVVQQVINQAGTAGAIYTDAPFDEDDSPSYPLDLYYNEGVNTVQVWSQSMAGGLPTSHVSGLSELKIATYRLDSAVSMLKKYARKARLDVVSKSVERMAQEVLVKQERNAWAIILKALADASTTTTAGAKKHVVKSRGAGPATSFQLQDLNDIMTRMKRINESFAGGTPANPYSRGITDLYTSPERMADIRSFAYSALGGSTSGASATDLPAGVRQEIFDSAGMQEIYGVNIVELIELGVGQKYNDLFDTLAGSTGYPDINDTNTEQFGATDEIMVGIDNSKGSFIRPIARGADGGSTFVAMPDNQFATDRADKLGFYGFMEEGRVCIDSRAIVGMFLDLA